MEWRLLAFKNGASPDCFVVVVRDTPWCVFVHSTPACTEPGLIENHAKDVEAWACACPSCISANSHPVVCKLCTIGKATEIGNETVTQKKSSELPKRDLEGSEVQGNIKHAEDCVESAISWINVVRREVVSVRK